MNLARLVARRVVYNVLSMQLHDGNVSEPSVEQAVKAAEHELAIALRDCVGPAVYGLTGTQHDELMARLQVAVVGYTAAARACGRRAEQVLIDLKAIVRANGPSRVRDRIVAEAAITWSIKSY